MEGPCVFGYFFVVSFVVFGGAGLGFDFFLGWLWVALGGGSAWFAMFLSRVLLVFVPY